MSGRGFVAKPGPEKGLRKKNSPKTEGKGRIWWKTASTIRNRREGRTRPVPGPLRPAKGQMREAKKGHHSWKLTGAEGKEKGGRRQKEERVAEIEKPIGHSGTGRIYHD